MYPKMWDFMKAQGAQFTLVNEHFKRLRKPTFWISFSIAYVGIISSQAITAINPEGAQFAMESRAFHADKVCGLRYVTGKAGHLG